MLMYNWLITSLESVRTLLINFTILFMHLLLIYSLKNVMTEVPLGIRNFKKTSNTFVLIKIDFIFIKESC